EGGGGGTGGGGGRAMRSGSRAPPAVPGDPSTRHSSGDRPRRSRIFNDSGRSTTLTMPVTTKSSPRITDSVMVMKCILVLQRIERLNGHHRSLERFCSIRNHSRTNRLLGR